VTLKGFYFCACCMDMYGLHAGTHRAYIPMEFAMHTGLTGSRGAPPTSAAVTMLAHFDVLSACMYTTMVDSSRVRRYSVEQLLSGPQAASPRVLARTNCGHFGDTVLDFVTRSNMKKCDCKETAISHAFSEWIASLSACIIACRYYF
jgi:hypothetical protein